MIIWGNFTESGQAWNDVLLGASDRSVFQTWGWGEYKSLHGWKAVRYMAVDGNGRVRGMVQLLIKTVLGVKVLWAPAGPVFGFDGEREGDTASLLRALVEFLRTKYPRSLVRLHPHRENSSARSCAFASCMQRAAVRLVSGYTISMQTVDRESFLQQMNSKHRYYARKSDKVGIIWRFGDNDDDIRDFVRVHQDMCDAKNKQHLSVGWDEMRLMREALGGNLLILNGSHDGEVVTTCAVLHFGGRAFYMHAATNAQGRRLSAAYAMIMHLVPALREMGIVDFDFGGIDPGNPEASGVDHFKRGFGGRVVEHIGEWELASSESLRWGINLAMKLRGMGA